jgi:hypothetical protein
MNIATEPQAETFSDYPPQDDHDALLCELNAFNREAISLLEEGARLKPESDAFSEAGEKLAAVVKIGLEALSPEEFARFQADLDKIQAWQKSFEPRMNALLARAAAHEKHRKDLMKRLAERNLIVDLPATPLFSRN